jgi:glycosyltransferase involved in cell wall biosynthesis
MQVGVDARGLHGARGIARCTRGMLGALRGVRPVLVAPRPRLRRPLFAAAALTGRPRLDRMASAPVDAVWLPAPAPVAVSRDARVVLTVHDLSWRARPEDFTRYERLWHVAMRFERLLARADAVVCVTAAVRDELGRPDAVVVPHGVTPLPEGVLPPGLPPRFVLFAGALEPRKDPVLVARAARRAGIPAVFAGAGRLAADVAAHGGRVLGPVDDPTLGALYRAADALVLPSRLEGFGFPPLEAALAGTPAVVSDLPVFRETLGADGARFVAPGDEAGLAAALAEVDGATVPVARARAEALTWERAAGRLRAVLESVA